MAVCFAPPHLYSSRVPASLHHSHIGFLWLRLKFPGLDSSNCTNLSDYSSGSWGLQIEATRASWIWRWEKKKTTARKRRENNNSKNRPGISQLLVAPVASWLVKVFFWYLLSWIRLTMSNFSPLQGLTYCSTPSPCSSSHLSICKDSLSI